MVKNLLRLLSVSDRNRRRLHHSQALSSSVSAPLDGRAKVQDSCSGAPCPSLGARWTLTRLHAYTWRILQDKRT